MQIAPIPTCWQGYHFRSRLEARWAVFFTFLEIEFHYEPEGVQLSDGVRYLPDFFLPVIKHWAEVKPVAFTPEERRKAELLVKESGCPCLFLVGPPDFRFYDLIELDAGDDLTRCVASLDIDAHYRRYYHRESRLFANPGEPISEQHSTDQYREAVYMSRAARFERNGT